MATPWGKDVGQLRWNKPRPASLLA